MLELTSIREYLKHVGGPPSEYDDFDVRKMSGNICYKKDFEPVSHRIFSLAIYKEAPKTGDENHSPVFKFRFKTPYQIVSKGTRLSTDEAYFVCWTEKFLLDYNYLDAIINDMPYLRRTFLTPLELSADDFKELAPLYQAMMTEFAGARKDRFNMIVSYLQTLMLKIKRIYEDSIEQDEIYEINSDSETAIAEKFRDLLAFNYRDIDAGNEIRTVNYYAGKLAVHPNHLNVVLKKAFGKTAQGMLHEQLLYLSKNMLVNTTMSIKSIAYELSFNDPAHFNNFFKKRTGATPVQFRNSTTVRLLN